MLFFNFHLFGWHVSHFNLRFLKNLLFILNYQTTLMISDQPLDMNEEEQRNSQEGNEEDFEFTERNMEI